VSTFRKRRTGENIDPGFVRGYVLKKIIQHRESFFGLVNQIYKKEGKDKDFREEWPGLFVNKMNAPMI